MDRLDREAAWLNLVAVLRQVTELTDSTVEDWEIPTDCNLRPVRRDEVRLPRGNGEYALFDTRQNTAVVEFLVARLGHEFGIQTHVPDRCFINTCRIHWAISCGMLWTPYFDVFHSLGNTLRNQAKQCGKWSGNPFGFMWKGILDLLIVFNQNAGPYRSGQWFEAKKAALERWCLTRTPASADFQEILHPYGVAMGKRTDLAEDVAWLFNHMQVLKHLTKKGRI